MANRRKDDGNEEESNGKIVALYEESVFHSGCFMKDDGLSAEDIYVHFGDEEPQGIQDELSKRIDKAKGTGLSEKSSIKIRDKIEKHKSIYFA